MITGVECGNPRFVFDQASRTWGPCLECGRLAWSHEQADPLADMANAAAVARGEAQACDVPPVMRSMPV